MKHIFIINPAAGKGDKAEKLKREIKKHFEAEQYYIEMTTKKSEATLISKRYAKTGVEMIFYACGGDGTVNEVVNGIYKYRNASLAIIPIGTGNDFVKSLPHPIQDLQNIQKYINPEYMTCDLLSVDNYVGINNISVGFDVAVSMNASRFKKIPFANEIVPYTMSLVYSMAQSLSDTYRVKFNDIDIKEDFTFIVVCNGGFYGGGYKPYPAANIRDNIIDLVFIQGVTRRNLLKLSKHYEKGTHLQFKDLVTIHKCKEVTIMHEEPIYLSVDGEIIKVIDPTIKILENGMRLVIPSRK